MGCSSPWSSISDFFRGQKAASRWWDQWVTEDQPEAELGRNEPGLLHQIAKSLLDEALIESDL